MAYGIAVGAERHGSAIASWKIVFLCTGLLTVFLGAIFLWMIPDNQLNAWWLKKEDRVLAIARVRINQQGIGNKHFKLYQVKEALMDPMTWAFFFYAVIADIPNGGITNFFNQLVPFSPVFPSNWTSKVLMSYYRSPASATHPNKASSTASPAAPSKSLPSLSTATQVTSPNNASYAAPAVS